VVETKANGPTGVSEPTDVARLVAFLDSHGEFDAEPDWFNALGATKLACDDTEHGLLVARQITRGDASEEASLEIPRRLLRISVAQRSRPSSPLTKMDFRGPKRGRFLTSRRPIPLFEPLNAAIVLIVGNAERSPKAFRANTDVDMLAVLSIAHQATFTAVCARARSAGAVLPESRLTAAVAWFEAKVSRELRTGAGWATDAKGTRRGEHRQRCRIRSDNWCRATVQCVGRTVQKFAGPIPARPERVGIRSDV
jgi:hypothetical protein